MIETNVQEEDIKIEGSLRPQKLADYIGQDKIKEKLSIYIKAAKDRSDSRSWKNHVSRNYCKRNGR